MTLIAGPAADPSGALTSCPVTAAIAGPTVDPIAAATSCPMVTPIAGPTYLNFCQFNGTPTADLTAVSACSNI
jgi:hypothetical protein